LQSIQIVSQPERFSGVLANLVCGYSRYNRERKTIMVLQAFIDDSKSESGDREFVLAGYMTTAAQWMKFSDEWEGVLGEYPAVKNFHMVEAQNLRGEFEGFSDGQRDKKVMRLAEIIERHPMMSFDVRLSQVSFNRILLPACPYDLRNPFHILFHVAVYIAAKQLHMNQIRVPIDFIFDEQGIVGEDSAMWYGFIRAMLPEELKPLLGSRMEAEKQSKATASHVPASHAKRD
jgi:hypothetical protein